MDSTSNLIARATHLAPLLALSLVLAVPAAHADHDNERPTASFTVSPSNPVTGERVTFTSTSTDEDGRIVSQAWDLDNDRSCDDGSTATVSRTFDSAGTYKIKLRVTDDDGARRDKSVDLVVRANPEPEPDPNSGPAPPAGNTPPASFPAPVINGPKPPKPMLIAPRLLDPFPRVRIRGVTTARGARLDLLSVRTSGGTTILVRCKGRSCPWTRQSKRARFSATRLRAVKMPGFRRRHLRAGTVLAVFVTKKGMIGKYTRFKIRRLKAPRRTDSCTAPGRARVRRCPA